MKNPRWEWYVVCGVYLVFLFLTGCSGGGGGGSPSPSPSPSPTLPVHNINQDKYYATIQAAIDDAQDGDKIVVSPGTYLEHLNFEGKNIAVRSENPNNPSIVAATVIDGGGTGTVVKFLNGETQDATLEGFTIQNGRGTAKLIMLTYFGGGIYIENASPTITRNVIRDNHVTSSGGGIYISGIASPKIVDNTIEENTANLSGGGVAVVDTASPIIDGNTFRNNQAGNTGGGLFVGNAASVKDASGTPWGKSLCPPDGTQAGSSWIYYDNTFSGNTHENGQDSEGCHVYMVI